jgi:hypothetical protein
MLTTAEANACERANPEADYIRFLGLIAEIAVTLILPQASCPDHAALTTMKVRRYHCAAHFWTTLSLLRSCPIERWLGRQETDRGATVRNCISCPSPPGVEEPAGHHLHRRRRPGKSG